MLQVVAEFVSEVNAKQPYNICLQLMLKHPENP